MRKSIIRSYKKLQETNILSNFFNLSGIQFSNIVLLLLIIRLVTGVVGIEIFGLVMFANRFAQTAGIIVNYGTNLSGVRDVAHNHNEFEKLSAVFYNILWIRAMIFTVFLLIFIGLYWAHLDSYNSLLLAMPIVLSEVFNPLCFFIGTEKIRTYNIYNLLSNIVAIVSILIFIRTPDSAFWVNFILGIINTITYFGLFVHISSSLKIGFKLPAKTEIAKTAKDNFYLTINNLSGNLQQSIIIYVLGWNNSVLLGAYTLSDRIISQCRNLLNTIANAIYPNATRLYKESHTLWNVYRRKTKYKLMAVFFVGAILIFILADFIVFTLSNEHDANAIMVLRIMAFVPVISTLNVMNMLDLLLKNSTVYLFKISIGLLIASLLVAAITLKSNNYILIGGFTLIIEICAFLLSEFFIKKTFTKNA